MSKDSLEKGGSIVSAKNTRDTVRAILIPTVPFPDAVQSLVLAHESPVDMARLIADKLAVIAEDVVDNGENKETRVEAAFPNSQQETVMERVEKIVKIDGSERLVLLYQRKNYFVYVNGKIVMKACVDELKGGRKQIRSNDYDGRGRKFYDRNVIDGVQRSQANTEYDGDSENIIGYAQDVYDQKGILVERVIFRAQKLHHQAAASGTLPIWESTVTLYTFENGTPMSATPKALSTGTDVSCMFQKFLEQVIWPRQDAIPADSPLKDSYVPLVNQLRQGY